MTRGGRGDAAACILPPPREVISHNYRSLATSLQAASLVMEPVPVEGEIPDKDAIHEL